MFAVPENWQAVPLMKTWNTAVPCARRAESNTPWYVALPPPVQEVLDGVENLLLLIAEPLVAALTPLPWHIPDGGLIGPAYVNEKPKRETFVWLDDTEKATLLTLKLPLAPDPVAPLTIVALQIPGFGFTPPDEAPPATPAQRDRGSEEHGYEEPPLRHADSPPSVFCARTQEGCAEAGIPIVGPCRAGRIGRTEQGAR